MLMLALDTATPQVGIAIGSDAGLLGQLQLAGSQRHAEQLAPGIQYLCEQVGVECDQFCAIAVDVGPGLFTGLRVGITTAKVMAQALRIPVIGVSSLDLLAYDARSSHSVIVPAIDARRGEVFSAWYRHVPGGVQRVSEYEVASPEDLAAELAARAVESTLLVGDGARRYASCFTGIKKVELGGAFQAYPQPAALLDLAAAKYQREEFQQPWELEPMYLRKSDAEINWERQQI